MPKIMDPQELHSIHTKGGEEEDSGAGRMVPIPCLDGCPCAARIPAGGYTEHKGWKRLANEVLPTRSTSRPTWQRLKEQVGAPLRAGTSATKKKKRKVDQIRLGWDTTLEGDTDASAELERIMAPIRKKRRILSKADPLCDLEAASRGAIAEEQWTCTNLIVAWSRFLPESRATRSAITWGKTAAMGYFEDSCVIP
jgi:hypothetical protein